MDRNRITDKMRNVLIDHLDGTPNPIIQPASQSGLHARELSWRLLSTSALLARGLLRTDGSAQYRRQPKHTIITEEGRAVLARLFADYAEILVRSGFRVEELQYIAATQPLRWSPPESAKTPAIAE